jgi:putative Mg2+ transporter-C (MgtC) family protein
MPDFDEFLFRVMLAVIIGGLIGAEREFRSKSAGFRTMILICLGSMLFTTLSIHISGADTDRIASNIVTGIGFLGAGVIFKSDNRINGITTAATIWMVAALGMGIADGAYWQVAVAALITLVALWMMTPLERWIDRVNQTHTYRIVSTYSEDLLKEYEKMLEECNLKYKRIKRMKSGANIIGTWLVQGSEKNHNRFTKILLHHPAVQNFEF